MSGQLCQEGINISLSGTGKNDASSVSGYAQGVILCPKCTFRRYVKKSDETEKLPLATRGTQVCVTITT